MDKAWSKQILEKETRCLISLINGETQMKTGLLPLQLIEILKFIDST